MRPRNPPKWASHPKASRTVGGVDGRGCWGWAFRYNTSHSRDVKARVLRIMAPPAKPPGKIIAGDDPAAKAKELVKLLREEAKAI